MNTDRAQLEALGEHQHEIQLGFTSKKLAWEPGKQPERTPDVGGIVVGTDGPSIHIATTESGITTKVIMSPYNAFRAWVSLGMLLGLRIPKGTGIKL